MVALGFTNVGNRVYKETARICGLLDMTMHSGSLVNDTWTRFNLGIQGIIGDKINYLLYARPIFTFRCFFFICLYRQIDILPMHLPM